MGSYQNIIFDFKNEPFVLFSERPAPLFEVRVHGDVAVQGVQCRHGIPECGVGPGDPLEDGPLHRAVGGRG